MPSPIGHSIIGLTIYRAATRLDGPSDWRRVALCVLAANAPDLDFIPGLLIGEPDRFHHGASHGLFSAALFAIVVSLLVHMMKIDSIARSFPLLLGLYLSHLGLDCLSIDTAAPYGMPLFWPLRNTYYQGVVTFLPDIRRTNISASFLSSLFSAHNFRSVAAECVMFIPLRLLVLALRRRRSLSP